MSEAPSLGQRAFRGGVATAGAQAFRVALQLASVVILARLLAPADFGLMASVAPVIAFVALFQDLGLQQAIVQQKEINHAQLNRIFWATVALGVVCGVAVLTLSPGVAWFYHDARLQALTAAASFTLILGSLGTLPLGLLNREMRFGTLASIDIGAMLGAFLVTLAGAWAGLGYWSLMLTPISANFLTLIAAWARCGWSPRRPDRHWHDRELFAFGAHLTGFSLANYFARNLDNILIGRYAGGIALGYYDRAYKLLLFPLQNLNAPLARVMIPLLSRLNEDKPAFCAIYLRVAGLLAFVAVPGIAAAIAVSGEMTQFLFGPRWLPVAPIFAWLGLAGLLQPLNNSTGWVFIAQGKTRAMFHWGLFSSAITIGSFLIGLRWGAVGVAAAYAINDYVLRTPLLYLVMGRVGPVRGRDYLLLQLPLLASALATWLLVDFGRSYLGLGGLPLIAAAIFLSYGLSTGMLVLSPPGRAVLAEGFRLLRRQGSRPIRLPGDDAR